VTEGRAARTVAAVTLGCRVNQYDTEAMLAHFRRRGYRVVPFGELADVYLVNTCTVTREADRQSRQLIRRARRRNPDAVVVVAGCYAQVAPDEVARVNGVNVVVGHTDRERVVDLVEAVAPFDDVRVAVGRIFAVRSWDGSRAEGGPRTRAVVKVQEGCAEFCTYCIVPFARGRPRSRPVDEVRAEVERLAAAGYQEVVLAGVHLGAYGRDLPGRPRLARLVRALEGAVPRLRLSSLEPMDADGELVAAMAEVRGVCPHLHLPVQSGSDDVLRRMGRRYTAEGVLRRLEAARRVVPGLAVTADLMVGFPGETDALWRETRAFLDAAGFARLHVFPFSPRPGTPAAAMVDRVPAEVVRARVREAIAWSRRAQRAFAEAHLGRPLEVLVEEERRGDGYLVGLTPDSCRVFLRGHPVRRGTFVRVVGQRADEEGVWAEGAA
jgi:threonylcarbamoyladenosine tRNA methylthiotransferase MtaB